LNCYRLTRAYASVRGGPSRKMEYSSLIKAVEEQNVYLATTDRAWLRNGSFLVVECV